MLPSLPLPEPAACGFIVLVGLSPQQGSLSRPTRSLGEKGEGAAMPRSDSNPSGTGCASCGSNPRGDAKSVNTTTPREFACRLIVAALRP